MTSGEESKFSPGWTMEATAKVETEVETWRSRVFCSITMILYTSSDHINASAYMSKIIGRQRGNRTRDLEVVTGSLIDGGD